ncbi:MAG TPA: hypothetical protein VIM11_26525, partial [Tepidisphaeraceae bacterium]
VDESDETKSKRAEGFLSPQDLAAAFNLDFRPKGGQARKQQQQQSPARRSSSRKPRWGRRFLALIFLAALGGVAYELATKPALRAQAITYATQAADWTKHKYAEIRERAAAKPTRSPSVSPTPNVTPEPLDTSTPTPAAPIPHDPTTDDNASTPPRHQAAPATAPQVAPTSSPSPWDKLYGAPQQSKPDTTTPKQSAGSTETPPPTAPAAVKRTGTLDDVRALYRQAIDAEGDNDFATAVKKYQQIKEFPTDLWPADLTLRLNQAKRQL